MIETSSVDEQHDIKVAAIDNSTPCDPQAVELADNVGPAMFSAPVNLDADVTSCSRSRIPPPSTR